MESLRTASALRVLIVRKDVARELVFPIVGAPVPKKETKDPGSASAAPAPASSQPETTGVLSATGSPTPSSAPKSGAKSSAKSNPSKGAATK
jgi:hypothetical protein